MSRIFPIGGGKESIDIGIKASDSKYVFVELKPWKTNNSPIYVGGYQAGFYQDQQVFYALWPKINFSQEVGTGDGTPPGGTRSAPATPPIQSE